MDGRTRVCEKVVLTECLAAGVTWTLAAVLLHGGQLLIRLAELPHAAARRQAWRVAAVRLAAAWKTPLQELLLVVLLLQKRREKKKEINSFSTRTNTLFLLRFIDANVIFKCADPSPVCAHCRAGWSRGSSGRPRQPVWARGPTGASWEGGLAAGCRRTKQKMQSEESGAE